MAVAIAACFVFMLSLAAPNARQAAAQDSVTIDIVDFAFSGGSITIEAGTTVTWVNQGAVNHTATGDSGEFDTGQIAAGGSASFTFDTPGTYSYHCANHPDMVGTITVSATSGGSTDNGSTDNGSTDEATQLPTTGTGNAGGGMGSAWISLSVLAALALVFGVGALRRRAV
jgi:plastocyanin